jgi:hypothetical protein
MCPLQVCVVCGEPRRRITETVNAIGVAVGRRSWRNNTEGKHTGDIVHSISSAPTADVRTLGWTDCGHDNYRPGHVLDPFGGSGSTAVAAALSGRDATLIDLDRRNVDLCRKRLRETLGVISETVDGDTTTWVVRADLPGLKGEHPDQQSLFEVPA